MSIHSRKRTEAIANALMMAGMPLATLLLRLIHADRKGILQSGAS